MTALRQALDLEMTEDDMRVGLLDAARLGGWFHFHSWRSDHSEAGWPDDVFLRGGEMLVWELKRTKGKTTPAQNEWLAAFEDFKEAHGIGAYMEVGVLRPADYDRALAILMARR